MKKTFIWISCIIMLTLLLVGCAKRENKVSAEGGMSYLNDFLFDGYENFTIKEYREKIKSISSEDEEKYKDFFIAIENNEEPSKLYEPGTDEYYLFNVIIPTVSDLWEDWSIGTLCTNKKYQIEYAIEYSILNTEKLTVKERDNAIEQIYNSIANLVKESSEKDYDLNDMEIKFNDMAESLESEFSNENFTVFVSGVCSTEEDVKNSSEDGEGITKTKVDKKDYEKILELKTEDIAEKTVSDFLNIYVEKVQSEEFQNIQNKVFRSITENNIPTYLSDEDLDFLTITLEATSSEFIALYHEKSEKNVIEYSIDSISDDSNNDKYNFFMNYEVTYTMSDSTKILIKDRDAGIRAIKEGAKSYIKDKTKDELMHGGMKDLKNFLDEIAENNSNDDIKFSIFISSYKIE